MVRARMPYLRGRGCRRGRGVCSSPRGRGRRWQRRRNICNNRSSVSKKMQNVGHHLQIRCSFFLMKLGSLALCAFPPGILLSKLLLLLQHHLSLLLVRLRYVLPAQLSPGVGRCCFPVFIGLPSAAAQLSVLSQAFSGPQNIIILWSHQRR